MIFGSSLWFLSNENLIAEEAFRASNSYLCFFLVRFRGHDDRIFRKEIKARVC